MMGRLLQSLALMACICTGATAQESPYDVFDLDVAKAGSLTVHYEKVLAPAMPETLRRIDAFLAETAWSRATGDAPAPSPDAIADDIVSILGITERSLRAMLVQILTAYGPDNPFLSARERDLHLYIITADSMKAHLRSGGMFPNMSYDPATNMCTYLVKFGVLAGAGSPDARQASSTVSFAVPVKAVDSAPEDTMDILRTVADPGIGIHEAVEVAAVNRLRRQDRQMRWFYEGLANAVAARLLERHFGGAAGNHFRKNWDVDEWRSFEKELLLLYWPPESEMINTLLTSEAELFNARYAFSTLEVERLLDACGTDCVKTIIDRAEGAVSTPPDALFEAIRSVTGEDLRQRLKAYQPFDAQQDGLRFYADRARSAKERDDAAAALTATLRLIELSDDYSPELTEQAVRLMHGMGRTDLADQLFARDLARLARGPHKGLLEEMQGRFVGYAIDTGRPEKAYSFAEKVLEKDDADAAALVVRAHRLASEGHAADAAKAAQRVLELADDDARLAGYARRLIDAGGTPLPFAEAMPPVSVDTTETR
jgi:tetratricopeptide (TPR) repeat protein